MPAEHITINMDGREILRVYSYGKVEFSKDIDWTKADSYFWEAIVKTICKEFSGQRKEAIRLGKQADKLNKDLTDTLAQNHRLRNLPDGTENEVEDRWAGILDER